MTKGHINVRPVNLAASMAAGLLDRMCMDNWLLPNLCCGTMGAVAQAHLFSLSPALGVVDNASGAGADELSGLGSVGVRWWRGGCRCDVTCMHPNAHTQSNNAEVNRRLGANQFRHKRLVLYLESVAFLSKRFLFRQTLLGNPILQS